MIQTTHRNQMDPARNSKLYIKMLYDLHQNAPRAGKRIGF